MCKKVFKGIGGLFGLSNPKTYTAETRQVEVESPAKTQQVEVKSPVAANVTNSNISNNAETNSARRKRKGFSSTLLADLASSFSNGDSDSNSTLG